MKFVFKVLVWKKALEKFILLPEYNLETTMKNAARKELAHQWYHLYRYLYTVAYDAIIDYFRRSHAEGYLLDQHNSTVCGQELLQPHTKTLTEISFVASHSQPCLRIKPFAQHLASQQNINRKGYGRKAKHEGKISRRKPQKSASTFKKCQFLSKVFQKRKKKMD